MVQATFESLNLTGIQNPKVIGKEYQMEICEIFVKVLEIIKAKNKKIPYITNGPRKSALPNPNPSFLYI